MDAPCKDCKKCGCGSYHDKCEIYQAYKKYREDVLNYLDTLHGGFVPRRTYRTPKVTPTKCHKK